MITICCKFVRISAFYVHANPLILLYDNFYVVVTDLENVIYKFQTKMDFIVDSLRDKLNIKGWKVLFTQTSCLAVFILLLVANIVKFSEVYDCDEKNTKREVISANNTAKHSAQKRIFFKPWERVRLPVHIKPEHYDMLIQVNLKELTFSGNSNISIQVTEPTYTIMFHINKLMIRKIEIFSSYEKTPFKIRKQFEYKKNQYFVVTLTEKLKVGEYKLKIKFNGDIETKELNGFYRSSYENDVGEKRYIISLY